MEDRVAIERIPFDDAERIADAIDAWHRGEGEGRTLAEYLGWSKGEYKTWIEGNSWTPARPCVRCGECCKASACGFGEYDREKKQCKHLALASVTMFPNEWGFPPPPPKPSIVLYRCAIAAEIVKDPTARVSPAFGAGCCRTLFNEARDKIIWEMKK